MLNSLFVLPFRSVIPVTFDALIWLCACPVQGVVLSADDLRKHQKQYINNLKEKAKGKVVL